MKLFNSRYDSGYQLNQWKSTLQHNAISHWLSPYPESSLHRMIEMEWWVMTKYFCYFTGLSLQPLKCGPSMTLGHTTELHVWSTSPTDGKWWKIVLKLKNICMTNFLLFIFNHSIIWIFQFNIMDLADSHKYVLHYKWNSSPPNAPYMRRWTGPTLVQIMACCLVSAKPLSELMLKYCQLDP